MEFKWLWLLFATKTNPEETTEFNAEHSMLDQPCAAARLYISKARWNVSSRSNSVLSSETPQDLSAARQPLGNNSDIL